MDSLDLSDILSFVYSISLIVFLCLLHLQYYSIFHNKHIFMIICHYVYVTFFHVLYLFEGDFSAPPIGFGRNDVRTPQVSLKPSVSTIFLLKLSASK